MGYTKTLAGVQELYRKINLQVVLFMHAVINVDIKRAGLCTW